MTQKMMTGPQKKVYELVTGYLNANPNADLTTLQSNLHKIVADNTAKINATAGLMGKLDTKTAKIFHESFNLPIIGGDSDTESSRSSMDSTRVSEEMKGIKYDELLTVHGAVRDACALFEAVSKHSNPTKLLGENNREKTDNFSELVKGLLKFPDKNFLKSNTLMTIVKEMVTINARDLKEVMSHSEIDILEYDPSEAIKEVYRDTCALVSVMKLALQSPVQASMRPMLSVLEKNMRTLETKMSPNDVRDIKEEFK